LAVQGRIFSPVHINALLQHKRDFICMFFLADRADYCRYYRKGVNVMDQRRPPQSKVARHHVAWDPITGGKGRHKPS